MPSAAAAKRRPSGWGRGRRADRPSDSDAGGAGELGSRSRRASSRSVRLALGPGAIRHVWPIAEQRDRLAGEVNGANCVGDRSVRTRVASRSRPGARAISVRDRRGRAAVEFRHLRAGQPTPEGRRHAIRLLVAARQGRRLGPDSAPPAPRARPARAAASAASMRACAASAPASCRRASAARSSSCLFEPCELTVQVVGMHAAAPRRGRPPPPPARVLGGAQRAVGGHRIGTDRVAAELPPAARSPRPPSRRCRASRRRAASGPAARRRRRPPP